MKTLAVLVALFGSSTFVVFAQTTEPMTTVPYAKEGALGIALAALVWALQHTMRVLFPEQQKRFTETIDKILVRDEQYHKDRLEESKELRAAIGELRENCRDFRRQRPTKEGEST